MSPGYSLTGLLVGFLIGLTGMGGGALMTPLLIMLLGVPPAIAVGSDLAYAAITKVVGAAQHYRQQTVHIGLAWRMGPAACPARWRVWRACTGCRPGRATRPSSFSRACSA